MVRHRTLSKTGGQKSWVSASLFMTLSKGNWDLHVSEHRKGTSYRQDAIPPCSWIKPALHIKLKLKAGPSIEGTEYASLRGLNTTNKKAFLEVHKPSPFQFSKPFNLTPTIANYVSWFYSEQHSFPLHNENKRYGDTSGCWERKDYVQVTTEQLVHRIFPESVVPCWLNKEQHGTSKANKCIVK